MKTYRLYDLKEDKKIYEVKADSFNDIKLEDIGIPFDELHDRDKYRFTVEK